MEVSRLIIFKGRFLSPCLFILFHPGLLFFFKLLIMSIISSGVVEFREIIVECLKKVEVVF